MAKCEIERKQTHNHLLHHGAFEVTICFYSSLLCFDVLTWKYHRTSQVNYHVSGDIWSLVCVCVCTLYGCIERSRKLSLISRVTLALALLGVTVCHNFSILRICICPVCDGYKFFSSLSLSPCCSQLSCVFSLSLLRFRLTRGFILLLFLRICLFFLLVQVALFSLPGHTITYSINLIGSYKEQAHLIYPLSFLPHFLFSSFSSSPQLTQCDCVSSTGSCELHPPK